MLFDREVRTAHPVHTEESEVWHARSGFIGSNLTPGTGYDGMWHCVVPDCIEKRVNESPPHRAPSTDSFS